MSNTQYSIYGNDNQQILNEIFKQKDEICDLVYQKMKNEVENRKKTNEKYKKVFNTKANINSNQKEIDDVSFADFDDYSGKNEDVLTKNDGKNTKIDIEPQKIDKTLLESRKNLFANKKQVRVEKIEQKKKNPLKVIVGIFVILIVLSLLGVVGYQLYIEEFVGNNMEKETTIEISEEAKDVATVTPQEEIVIVGKIEDIDVNKEYTIVDSLKYANKISLSLNEYWNELSSEIEESKDTKVLVDKSYFETQSQMVSSDINILGNYIVLFEPFDGRAYYDATIKRFENLKECLDTIKNYENIDLMINTVNEKISIENKLNETATKNLESFLDKNGLKYQKNAKDIQYEIQGEENMAIRG